MRVPEVEWMGLGVFRGITAAAVFATADDLKPPGAAAARLDCSVLPLPHRSPLQVPQPRPAARLPLSQPRSAQPQGRAASRRQQGPPPQQAQQVSRPLA